MNGTNVSLPSIFCLRIPSYPKFEASVSRAVGVEGLDKRDHKLEGSFLA